MCIIFEMALDFSKRPIQLTTSTLANTYSLDLVDNPPRTPSTIRSSSNGSSSSSSRSNQTNSTTQSANSYLMNGNNTSLMDDYNSVRMNENNVETSNASAASSERINGNMKFEKNRLDTFTNKNWRCSFMDVNKLAKNGFYYFGHDDHVRCAFCNIVIGQWEPGDDPVADHRRWAPDCLFIKGCNVGNVPINPNDIPSTYTPISSIDTCGRYNIEIIPVNLAEESEIKMVNQSNSGPIDLSELGIDPINCGPAYTSYRTYESRVNSFKEWPVSMKQKPEELAAAGFFYTGKGDQTLCYHCGGGLKDWEVNDDPWEQHAKWFSKCTFVVLQKGHEFIRKVCNENPPKLTPKEALFLANSCNTTASTSSNNSVENSSSELISNSSEELNNSSELSKKPNGLVNGSCKPNGTVSNNVSSNKDCIKNKLDKTNDASLCKICYTEELSVVFLPCRHMVSCIKCATSLTECAVCRKPFTAIIRAYLS